MPAPADTEEMLKSTTRPARPEDEQTTEEQQQPAQQPEEQQPEQTTNPPAGNKLPAPITPLTRVRGALAAPEDEDQRHADAISNLETQRRQQWEQQMPFAPSGWMPAVRPDEQAAAVRQSDYTAQKQQRQQKNVDLEEQRQVNSQREAQFRATGQSFYRDPYGDLQPVIDTTGRPMYRPTGFETGENEKGETMMVRRNAYGKQEYKTPPITTSGDPADENLYYNLPDGELKPIGKIDDLKGHTNPTIAHAAAREFAHRHAAMWREAINGVESANGEIQGQIAQATADHEAIGTKAEDIQKQIDTLRADPHFNETTGGILGMGGKPSDAALQLQTKANQLQLQLETTQQQQADIAGQIAKGGELDVRAKQAKADLAIYKLKAGHDNAKNLADVRRAILDLQGKTDKNDPVLSEILKKQDEFAKGIQQATDFAKTLGPRGLSSGDAAERPLPGLPDQLQQEPFAMVAKGVKQVGPLSIDRIAQLYGDGKTGFKPSSLLAMNQRINDIEETIQGFAGQSLAPKSGQMIASLKEEQDYLKNLYANRLTQLPADQQRKVTEYIGSLKTTAMGAVLRDAGVNIVPAMAAAKAGKVGGRLGTEIGAMIPGLGETGIGEAGGAIIGGGISAILGYMLADKAQRALIKAAFPDQYDKLVDYAAKDWDQHPIAKTLGGAAGQAPAFGLSAVSTARGMLALGKMAARQEVTAAETAAAKALAIKAGVATAQSVGFDLKENKSVDPARVLSAVAQMMILGGEEKAKGPSLGEMRAKAEAGRGGPAGRQMPEQAAFDEQQRMPAKEANAEPVPKEGENQLGAGGPAKEASAADLKSRMEAIDKRLQSLKGKNGPAQAHAAAKKAGWTDQQYVDNFEKAFKSKRAPKAPPPDSQFNQQGTEAPPPAAAAQGRTKPFEAEGQPKGAKPPPGAAQADQKPPGFVDVTTGKPITEKEAMTPPAAKVENPFSAKWYRDIIKSRPLNDEEQARFSKQNDQYRAQQRGEPPVADQVPEFDKEDIGSRERIKRLIAGGLSRDAAVKKDGQNIQSTRDWVKQNFRKGDVWRDRDGVEWRVWSDEKSGLGLEVERADGTKGVNVGDWSSFRGAKKISGAEPPAAAPEAAPKPPPAEINVEPTVPPEGTNSSVLQPGEKLPGQPEQTTNEPSVAAVEGVRNDVRGAAQARIDARKAGDTLKGPEEAQPYAPQTVKRTPVGEISAMSPDEIVAYAKSFKGNYTGGAYKIGFAAIGDEAKIEELRQAKDAAAAEVVAAVDADRADDALKLTTKSQFLREAYEAATNTASAAGAPEVKAAHADYQARQVGMESTTVAPDGGSPAQPFVNPAGLVRDASKSIGTGVPTPRETEILAAQQALVDQHLNEQKLKTGEPSNANSQPGPVGQIRSGPETTAAPPQVAARGAADVQQPAGARQEQSGGAAQAGGAAPGARPEEVVKTTPRQAAQVRTTLRDTDAKIQTLNEYGASRPALDTTQLPQGSQTTRPAETYGKANEAAAKTGNLWVRQSTEPSNQGRVLMVQFASDVLYAPKEGAAKTAADAYYDKLYQNRAEFGYKRMDDFWEVPQWQAVMTHSLGDKADLYVVRNLAEAKKFLSDSNYEHVAFSVFEPAKGPIEQLAASIKGKIALGGYPNTPTDSITGRFPNATRFDSVPAYINSLGLDYSPGFDYRLYKGSEVVPRLELSAGCRHRCTFCVVERAVTETPESTVNQQVDSFAALHGDLVYLNDKTFGQAANSKNLPALAERMRAANPDFKGFVIQTTAAQMRSFTPEFLKASGIKFAELGVESFNNSVLKLQRKPATEALIQEAADKLKANGIAFIPNIVIGLPGETPETYAHTMDFLRRNEDNISHANIYNLAVYEGSDLSKQIDARTAADADENVAKKSFQTEAEQTAAENFSQDLYSWASGVLDKTPASLQSAKPGQLELPLGEASGQLPPESGKGPALPKSGTAPIEQAPSGPPQSRGDLVSLVQRAGFADADPIVHSIETGDPKLFVDAAHRAPGNAGHMQSAYLQAKKLGLVPDTVDRAFRTSLLVQDQDLFRLIDDAGKTRGVGIVPFPNLFDGPKALQAVADGAAIAWKAAREALFNTTGGVSRQVFELFHQMRARNAATLDEVVGLAKGVARSFGGEITEEQQTIAQAYLDPRTLNRYPAEQAASIRQLIDQLTPEQKAALDACRDKITRGSEQLTEVGATKEGLSDIIKKNYGQYISRTYKIFGREGPDYLKALRTPGTEEYSTRYLAAIRSLAADGDADQSKLFVDRLLDTIQRKGELPRREIDQLVNTEVRRLGSNITLNRTLREDSIRNLFGEVTDPIQSVAHTVIKQQELLNSFIFRKQLADDLETRGLVRKVDPDAIVRDYAAHQAQIVEQEVQRAIDQETQRRSSAGQPPPSPEIVSAIATKVRTDNPLFSQKVRTRTAELLMDAKSSGRTPNMSAAQAAAEREVFSDHEDLAYKWYRDSGQMAPGESLFLLDPEYLNDMRMAKNINDPFAALVVTKEALPILTEYKKMLPKGMNLFQEATQLVNTGATVLSPATTARNQFTALQTIVSSGNAARLFESSGRDAVTTALKICNHLMLGTTLDPELRPLLNEMYERGVLSRGALSGDTANLIDASRDVYRRGSRMLENLKRTGTLDASALLGREGRMRPEEAVTRIAWGDESKLAGVFPWEAIARNAQDLYRVGDDFPKAINYLLEKAKGTEAYPDDPVKADAEAFRKFKACNYDYARVVPIVRLARQVPLFGLFTSFVSESHRVVWNSFGTALQDIGEGVKTGNAQLIRQGTERLAGTSLAVGGMAAYSENSRASCGMSYEDEKTLRTMLAPWSQNSHIYWYNFGDGHVKYINFGNNEMFSAVSRPASALAMRLLHGEVMDNPQDTLWHEAKTQAMDILQPFLSPQILSQAVLDTLKGAAPSGKPLYAADDSTGDKLVKAMQYIASKALEPGALKAILAAGKGGDTNKFGDVMRADQPLLNLAGLGDLDLKRSFMFLARSAQRSMQSIESEFRTMSTDLSTGVTPQTIYQKLDDVEQRRQQYYASISRAASLARRLGVSDEDLFTVLKQEGFQKRDIGTFLTGEAYLPFIPGRETYRRAAEAGRELDPDSIQAIVEKYLP